MKKNTHRWRVGIALLLITTTPAVAAAELRAQSCDAVSGLRSPPATANQLFTINNSAAEAVSVAWLDANGGEGRSSVVGSSKAASFTVAPGWAMVARDARGHCIAAYVMGSGSGSITIRDSMLPSRSVDPQSSQPAPVARAPTLQAAPPAPQASQAPAGSPRFVTEEQCNAYAHNIVERSRQMSGDRLDARNRVLAATDASQAEKARDLCALLGSYGGRMDSLRDEITAFTENSGKFCGSEALSALQTEADVAFESIVRASAQDGPECDGN